MEATGRSRRTLREGEVRKSVKCWLESDVSLIENQSVETILEKLEDAYTRLLPCYEVTGIENQMLDERKLFYCYSVNFSYNSK